MKYYDDNKKLNFKIFKLKFVHISNDVDEQLFEEIFGHKYVVLTDTMINTTSKEENQCLLMILK